LTRKTPGVPARTTRSAAWNASIKLNPEHVAGHGTPFVLFKYDVARRKPGSAWVRIWHYHNYRRQEFFSPLHKRSHVESTFKMIKAKFGSAFRSRTYVAIVNEIWCKVIDHNICSVTRPLHELGVGPDFGVGVS
jgi:hypothetical protein